MKSLVLLRKNLLMPSTSLLSGFEKSTLLILPKPEVPSTVSASNAMSNAQHHTSNQNRHASEPGNNGDVRYKIPSTRRLVPRASERRSKMIAFGYYGGKFSHLDFILPLLPTHFKHYCEVFGGSAAVLINRPPAPVETYNDLDGEVVNFFECLRDHGKELVRLISLTPFSRVELVKALAPATGLTTLERAKRFFARARQTRTGH